MVQATVVEVGPVLGETEERTAVMVRTVATTVAVAVAVEGAVWDLT